MQLSVYNALSITGQDMTVGEVVMFLSKHWDPAKSRNVKRLSAGTVLDAARELNRTGLVTKDGEVYRILARDPRSRRGETMNIDYQRAKLVRESEWL